MDLLIKRFSVRYQGKDYGPGSVIYGVPDEMAEGLVAESNGTIEALPARQAAEEAAPAAQDAGSAETGTAAESEGKPAAKGKAKAADDEASLPNVDPAATVK